MLSEWLIESSLKKFGQKRFFFSFLFFSGGGGSNFSFFIKIQYLTKIKFPVQFKWRTVNNRGGKETQRTCQTNFWNLFVKVGRLGF